ncbi:ribosomal protein S14 [Iris pallida]|uniref:Ribosomal protein S14 (Chloroplast) n=1 Tax=Iris pallida TaxID=29817 RepID=A0AAX6EQP3_IRIPA|nr:ribosomal protein S14 [Iris pallida]
MNFPFFTQRRNLAYFFFLRIDESNDISIPIYAASYPSESNFSLP